MTRVLMVCLGNICRSPLAEGILKDKTSSKDVLVDSAGTSSFHIGNSPDKRSIEIANKYAIDITNQKARKFRIPDFDNFDLIYVMDNSNYRDVIQLSRNQEDTDKVKLILNESFPDQNLDVPDPYTGADDGFKVVYKMLDKACDEIVKKIT